RFRQFFKLRVPNKFMKVMKVVDKKVGNTTYYKYRINLPKEAVEKLNLLNKELKVKVDKNRIIIEKE
ncbi:MAG: AbrB/MazE/SpoVT family DNA-binding domain-containing protein, partial [Nanoarchaeota archaeon]